MNDLISRKDVLNAPLKLTYDGMEWIPTYHIEELPSAEPRCIATIQLSQEQLDEAFEKVKLDILSVKPKTGKWIKVHWKAFRCSECNKISEYFTNFCPNCGSRMLEEGKGRR